jgi:hypothetical protein
MIPEDMSYVPGEKKYPSLSSLLMMNPFKKVKGKKKKKGKKRR